MKPSTVNTTEFFWQCPACGEPLQHEGKQWLCHNNHHFDCAKEGYVNLLLAHHKRSKAPGDNKQMMLARRHFLEQGHYQELADALAQSIKTHFNDSVETRPLSVCDAGCGEGYYLNRVFKQLSPSFTQLSIAGIDISKPAISLAAKRYKQANFAVASSFSLPLADASQDAVMQIFAPSSGQEVNRILRAGGIWMLVSPAPQHLLDLKKMVYDKPELHSVDNQIDEGFTLVEQKQLAFTLSLSSCEERENLLMMTPFYWTISETKKAQLLDSLSKVQAHFDIKILQKT